MKPSPGIRIELVDGTSTWIVWVPCSLSSDSAIDAVGEAAARLVKSLTEERVSVDRNLIAFHDFAIKVDKKP